jgi:hypothetical protein
MFRQAPIEKYIEVIASAVTLVIASGSSSAIVLRLMVDLSYLTPACEQ